VGESANTAFYAIVYAKRLVPPDRLQKALNKAMLEGLPLEKVVVGTGLLSPQECQSILRMRGQLGRVCRDCGETTYLLPDQNEGTTPCEFCGGRFLHPAQQQPTPGPQARAPSARRARPPSAKMARPPTQRHAPAGLGPDQLATVRDQILGEALKAVETKFAQEDLQGTLNRLVQEAVTRLSLQLGQQVGQQISQQLNAQLGKHLGPVIESRMGTLSQELEEQVSDRVRQELESLEIDSLENRITNQALRALQEQLPSLAPGNNGADGAKVEELAAQVNSLANRLTQAQQAMLGTDLQDQVERIDARLTEAQSSFKRDDRGLEGLAERLSELESRQREAQTSMKQDGGDYGALAERIGMLEAQSNASSGGSGLDKVDVALIVQEQLAEFDVEAIARKVVQQGGGGGSSLDADEVTQLAQRQARHAAQEVVTEIVRAQIDQLDLGGGGGDTSALEQKIAGLETQLSQLRAELSAHDPGGLDPAQLDQIAEQAALKAAHPIRKSVEIQLADLDLPNLEARIKRDVEASVAGSQALSMSGSGSVDVDAVVKRVMDQVETRLAEFDMAAEMAIQDASRQALEAVDERLSRLEENSGVGPALGEGTRATVERLEHEQRALTKLLRNLEKSVAAGGGGGGDVDVDAIAELVAQRVGGGGADVDVDAIVEQVVQRVGSAGGGDVDVDAIADLVAQRVGGGDTSKLERRAAQAADAVREDMQVLRSELSASLEEFTAWAESRFEALATASGDGGGGSGVVSHDQLEDILGAAKAAAEALIEERVSAGGGVPDVPPRGQTGTYNKKFVALAREVKHLKDKVEDLVQSPSDEKRSEIQSGRSVVNSPEFRTLVEARLKVALDKKLGDTGSFRVGAITGAKPDEATAVGLLNSVEFKSMFDTKINEVLRYLKMDLVPSLVKRTMREVESK